jgi:TRAP-type C4-dicarboxylate transport system permease small subunit
VTGLRRAWERIVFVLAALAGAIICAMALLIPVDVVLRACCGNAIFGLTDLSEHGLAAATFLAAPWVLSKNAHVSVDIALMALSQANRRRLDTVVNLLGAAICAIFMWYSAVAMLTALQRGSMVRGIIVVPEWITFAAPTLSLALLAIGFLLRLGVEKQDSATQGF